MTQENKNKRLDWLDVLKCLAMFLVVLGHVNRDVAKTTLRYYIYSFHMPLFFIISGIGFYLQTRKREFSFKEMLENKTRTLLKPYFLFNIILIPLWIYNYKILRSKEESFLELILAIFYSNQKWRSLPTSTTWFITTLFLTIMLFFLLIKWVKNDDRILVLYGLFIGLFAYANSIGPVYFNYPWHMDTALMGVMFVMIGYLFMKHIEFFEKIIGMKIFSRILGFVFLLLSGFCCAFFNVKISMSLNSYGSFFLFMGSCICFSGSCYILSRFIPALYVFKLIGRNTICYLAIHEQIFALLRAYNSSTIYFIENYPYITAILVFIAIIPFAWAVEKYFPFLIGKKHMN